MMNMIDNTIMRFKNRQVEKQIVSGGSTALQGGVFLICILIIIQMGMC